MRRVFGVLAIAGTLGSVPAVALDVVSIPPPAPEVVFAEFQGPRDLAADAVAARNLRAFSFARTAGDTNSAAPEPFIWALLLTGFGIVGLATRGRRTPPPVVA